MSQNKISTIHRNNTQPTIESDPEVAPRAKRRTYSAAYKLRILISAQKKTCASLRANVNHQREREIMIQAVEALAQEIPQSIVPVKLLNFHAAVCIVRGIQLYHQPIEAFSNF